MHPLLLATNKLLIIAAVHHKESLAAACKVYRGWLAERRTRLSPSTVDALIFLHDAYYKHMIMFVG